MTAATVTRPNTRTVAKPEVSKAPVSSAERDFIKGRDSAIGCLEEAQHFHDAQSEEPNRMRWIRKGKPQDNFVHGWIADAVGGDSVMQNDELRGFCAVLSDYLSNPAGTMYPHAYRIPYAEYLGGEIGADGTQAVPAELQDDPSDSDEVEPTPASVAASIKALTHAIDAAWRATDVEERADDASHILLAALNVAETLDDVETDSERESLLTIRALVYAANHTDGEAPTRERVASIQTAFLHLDSLIGEQSSQEGAAHLPTSRSAPVAATANEPPAVLSARIAARAVIAHIQAACEVLRMAQNENGPTEVFAIGELMDMLHEKHADAGEAKEFGDAWTGVLPDLQGTVCNVIALCKRVNSNGLDSQSLHAVTYLLESAYRIASDALAALPSGGAHA